MRIAILAVALCLLAAGCQQDLPNPSQLDQKLSADLTDGKTTREQILLRFGEPSGQFEGQRILTYRLNCDDSGKWEVVARRFTQDNQEHEPSWEKSLFSLVLVFNGPVLSKHSVVAVR
jgi:hypothetical protein